MLVSITNAPRDYAWGSTTLLAALEGRDPSGAPEAEVWFGDHPGDPAEVAGGGTLDAITGGSLPYLLKLLAAGDPLSIQVHPTREQARRGLAREAGMDPADPARSYRDANHKPELIVALSERFEALAGLRPVGATRRLLTSLPQTAGVRALQERLAGDAETEALRETIGWLLSGTATIEVDDIIAAVAAAEQAAATAQAEFGEELRALRAVAERCPGDPGVVVAMLMNFVVLAPGEAIFLPAGLLHAYVSGLGVEIMAASDNVLRGGLTVKHIDVDELLAILDATPGEVPVQRAEGDVTRYDAPVDDFSLCRVQVDGDRRIEATGPSIVLATAGSVTVSTAQERMPVPVGTGVFATADESVLTLSGRGQAFIAQPGRNVIDSMPTRRGDTPVARNEV